MRRLAAFAPGIHSLLHRLQGRPDAAAELLSLLPQPDRMQDGYLWQAHGHAAMAAGRVDEAADCFLRAAAECRVQGNRAAEAPLLPWLVEALVRCGRLAAAQAELERADAQAHLQDESTTANLLYPRALLARWHQQEPEAQALLARLTTAPAALPLFRRLGRELSAVPIDPRREHPMPMWWRVLFFGVPAGRTVLAMLKLAGEETRFHWTTCLGRIRGFRLSQ